MKKKSAETTDLVYMTPSKRDALLSKDPQHFEGYQEATPTSLRLAETGKVNYGLNNDAVPISVMIRKKFLEKMKNRSMFYRGGEHSTTTYPEEFKKAAFVADFCRNVYKAAESHGIDKTAFCTTELADQILKLAAAKPPMDKIVDMIGLGSPKGQLLAGLSVLGPLTLGGLGGAAAAKLTSPSQRAIENIQKEEVLARYNSAVEEAKARIAARRARATV